MQKHEVRIHLNTCGENFLNAMSKEELFENNARVLFSDERLDWLQNDDYGKWPGRRQCLSQHRVPLLSSNGTAISANAFQTYCWHMWWKVHIFSSSLSLSRSSNCCLTGKNLQTHLIKQAWASSQLFPFRLTATSTATDADNASRNWFGPNHPNAFSDNE